MDGRARQLCQEFFLRQIAEAQRMYNRVSACQCEHLGGKDCVCKFDEPNKDEAVDDPDTPFRLENGLDGTDINVRKDSISTKGNDDVDTAGRQRTVSSTVKSNDAALLATQRPARPHHNKVDRDKTDLVWRHRMIFSSGSVVNIKPLIKQKSMEEQSYEGLKNPFVIIVNNVYFKGMPVPRNGADADMENLNRFLREANFNRFEIYDNLDKNTMREVFQRHRKDPDLVNYDGLICFIMSHGSEKGILTADHSHIQVDEITAMFKGDTCGSLATKPKLFFIQACRGDGDDQGFAVVPRGEQVHADTKLDFSKVPVTLPSDTDFLVAYSTTKGKTSYRQYIENPTMMEKHMGSMGSWFISCLIQVLLVYSQKEDLLTMLTRVNKAMSELYTVQGYKQVSCYHSVLTKKVYFPTIDPSDNEDD